MGDTTRHGAREALVPPGGVRPDAGGLELTLASSALGGFSRGHDGSSSTTRTAAWSSSPRGSCPSWRSASWRARGWSPKADWLLPPADKAQPWRHHRLIARRGGPPDREGHRVAPAPRRRLPLLGRRQLRPTLRLGLRGLVAGRAEKAGYPVDRAALKRGQELAGIDRRWPGRCIECGTGCEPASDPATGSSRSSRWPAPATPAAASTPTSTPAASSCRSSPGHAGRRPGPAAATGAGPASCSTSCSTSPR